MELGNIATIARNCPRQKVWAHDVGQIDWGLVVETNFAAGNCIYLVELHNPPRSETIHWLSSSGK